MSDIKREMPVYLSRNNVLLGLDTILAKMYFFLFVFDIYHALTIVLRYIENKCLTWQQLCLHIKKYEFCILLITLQLTFKFWIVIRNALLWPKSWSCPLLIFTFKFIFKRHWIFIIKIHLKRNLWNKWKKINAISLRGTRGFPP